MPTGAVNYLLQQGGWFACILGVAWGHEATGVALALAFTTAHLLLSRERRIEAWLLAAAIGVGVINETLQLAMGTYRSLPSMLPAAVPPLWLLVLWAQFAMTFRYSLAGIIRRPARAAIFGALGGPVAFLAAARLGALQLLPPTGLALIRLSVAWALALVVFSWLTRRWWPSDAAAVYRQLPAARRSP